MIREYRRSLLILTAVFFAAIVIFSCLCPICAYAASIVEDGDGVYSVLVDMSGLAMGADNFSSTSTVEKSENNYYFTFGHSSSISSLRLVKDDKQVGYTVRTESDWTYYTYTLSESGIRNSLNFTAHINAMDRDVSFSVKLNLSGATRTGDYIYDGERPAEFVPVITASAGGEYEVQRGTVFVIPTATAVLGTEECNITTTAYYLTNGEKQNIEISDDRFILENVGEYHLIYKASSPSYKTNFGNDSYTEYDVKIISSAGGSTLARFEDPNGIIPNGTAIMPSRITEGSVYDVAAANMKEIADNFEVFGISLIAVDGNTVLPSDNIELYLQPDSTYDRTKTVVYRMDENGNLTRLETSGYGRYVKVYTDKIGTFLVCVPGVAFVMPMWGYAVICCVCGAIVIAAAITIPILVIKKRKKKKAQA